MIETRELSQASDLLLDFFESRSSELVFLPEDYDSDEITLSNIYSASVSDIRKVFLENSISPSYYLLSETPKFRHRNSADWYGPILAVGDEFVAQHPQIFSVMLNIFSSYLYDRFRGKIDKSTIEFKIVIRKKNKVVTEIKYKGNVDGMKELGKLFNQISDE